MISLLLVFFLLVLLVCSSCFCWALGIFWYLVYLGVSIRTQKLTHPPKLPGLTWRWWRSEMGLHHQTDLGRSDGGFSSSKLNIPDPTGESEERTPVLPRSIQIHWYSGEKFGSFWLDSVKILVFLLRFGGGDEDLLDFYLDPAWCGAFALILLISRLDFGFDSYLMWCFCLNLGLI